MSEHAAQVALFKWAAHNEGNYPELEMLYAIPNGGKRNIGTARKLKAEGVKAGVWDVSLDVARDGWHGFKLEMKYGKNNLTDSQIIWEERYHKHGYFRAVCWDWADAARQILIYLGYDIPEDLE